MDLGCPCGSSGLGDVKPGTTFCSSHRGQGRALESTASSDEVQGSRLEIAAQPPKQCVSNHDVKRLSNGFLHPNSRRLYVVAQGTTSRTASWHAKARCGADCRPSPQQRFVYSAHIGPDHIAQRIAAHRGPSRACHRRSPWPSTAPQTSRERPPPKH